MKNYNVAPYFDDFDPSKNYHRILFKPGQAVQARELTQSQTILQNQISDFASAIYSQNTPISGGKVTTNLNCNYIKLNAFFGGVSVVVADFLGKTITNSTGTILAKVIAIQEQTSNEVTFEGDPPTLIVTYLSGTKFTDATTIYNKIGNATIPAASTIGVEGGTTCTGPSSVASISNGIFYVVNGYNTVSNTDGTTSKYSIGNFVNVAPQTIVLEKYDNTPSYRVGLNIVEETVSSSSDLSLLDPATGSSNYQAPGADRYSISLELVNLPLTLGSDDQFIELLRIENGKILKQTDQTVYSTIDDYFAKRDYESNGDYVVEDFKLTSGSNNGGNSSKYDLNIGKGVAYVRGYRIENQSQFTITSDRARDTATISPNSVFMDYGNYLVVNKVKGAFDYTTIPTVDLHCVYQENISSGNTATYNSTKIGTCLLRNLDYQSSTGSNTQTYIFNAHVADINLNALTGETASATSTTLTVSDSTSKFSSSNTAYVGVRLKITSGTNITDEKMITAYNGVTKTFTIDGTFNITPDTTSKFALLYSIENVNSIVQVNGSFAQTSYANISTAGKVNGVGTNTILEAAGNQELIFKNGYQYSANVYGSNYYSTQVFRGVGFNSVSKTFSISTMAPISFEAPIGVALYGETFKELFTVVDTSTGNILDFSTSSNFVTLTSNTSATFTTDDYDNINSGIAVYAKVFVSNGNNTNLVLKEKNLTIGNTTYFNTFTAITSNTKLNLISGQALIENSAIGNSAISLYVADVKKITKILEVGDATTGALSSYTDITSSFSFDDGQRDSYYDHSTIKLLPGVNKPKANVLVIFDHYNHTGGDGYFSVNSYLNSAKPEAYAEIPSYTAKSGKTYQLRDCIDFRPVRKRAQAEKIWEYKTNTNLSNVDIRGALIPSTLTNFQSNYSYYLGRKDKLVLTKDSQFNIIKGTPAIVPQLPSEPDGSLVLANITLDPYTAYVQGEGPSTTRTVPSNLSINKITHKRWAKSDITNLQNQVNNLEYYTSLSLLEQKAQTLQVPDSNGLNRFKNGILVDDFSSFGVAETNAPGFAVNINIRKNQLTPLTEVDNFQLQNPDTLKSFGTARQINTYAVSNLAGGRTNIFTLPYSTKTIIKQELASDAVSANPFDVFTKDGVCTLNPPLDNWVNTVQPPAITITNPNMQFVQQKNGINVLNSGDFQTIPGTTTTYTETQSAIEDAYVSQTTSLLAAETSSAVAAGLSQDNGYISNNGVAPYIRRQEVIVRSKGMAINTPVDCFFDGVKVNEYMTTPNTIELTDVSGNYLQDDIVGFYLANVGKFFPVARVVGVYRYPDGTSVRLYISDLVNPPNTVTSTTLINATFDVSGNYVNSTASGTVTLRNGHLIDLATSGLITGPGGGFTSTLEPTPRNIFKSQIVNGFSTLANQYAVWGDPDNGSSYAASYSVPFDTAGTYTIKAFATGTGTVTLNGSTIITFTAYGQEFTYSYTATAGNKTLAWDIDNTGQVAGFSLVVYNSAGEIVWNTVTPNGLNFDSIGTEYIMPGGGSYYVGSNKIQLDHNASANDSYYVGATITINSSYVYEYNYGAVYIPPYPPLGADGDARNTTWWQALASQWQTAYDTAQQNKQSVIKYIATKSETALITAYDGATRTATLSTSVDVSMGRNVQYGKLQSSYSIRGSAQSLAASISQGTTPPSLSTDEHGQFVAIFNMPGSTFHTGQRLFRVDNRIIESDPTTATTYSQAIFTAGSLYQTNLTAFSPSVDSSSYSLTPINQQSYNILSNPSDNDPIAQTFIVSKDNYPNGVFLNSVKLFFAPYPGSSAPEVPVKLSIVNTLNGVPNGKVLDYSTVVLNSNEINFSTTPHYLDAKTYTEFTFDAPVYIQSGVLYAFIISTSSADYYLYYAQQNKAAIPSTGKALPTDPNPTTPTKIGASPYVGALFESQNSITWTGDQSKDLMFVVDQCVFDTTYTPQLPFVTPYGLPYKKLGSKDILQSIDSELVNNIVPVGSPTSPVHALNLTTTDFVPTSTKIDYSYTTTLTSDSSVTGSSSVTPGKFGAPLQDNIYLNDGLGERILLKDSNTSFSLLATMTSDDENVSPILSDDGITLYRLTYHINNMGIEGGNIITIDNPGTNYNANATSITVSLPDVGTDRAIVDFTANTVTKGIETIFVTYPGSGYLTTPTITITDASSNGTGAIVTVHGETSPSGGNAYAKYFTKKVILTPNNESGDLRVYYSAYKPLGTEVYVYYKILNPNDTEAFDNQDWQLMTPDYNANAYSKDRNDIIEYEWAPGTFGLGADNKISYVSTSGSTYASFTQFAIKVVLTTDDKTNVPFLTDIRALALPSGTGL